MLCWVAPSLAGSQNPLPCVAWRCFSRRGANLSSKQTKMDSEATAVTKCQESELTFLSSICMHSHGGEKKNSIFHFLLIAALPDTHTLTHTHTHVVGSAIGCCILGKVMRHYCCTRPQRNTQTHGWKTRCLKAERWFANELSWWQILPSNWLVKEAIRIQRVDAHQSRRELEGRLSVHYVWERALQSETHIVRPQPCHSLL